MDPMKRMIIIVGILLIVAAASLYGIYYSGKRLKERSGTIPAQDLAKDQATRIEERQIETADEPEKGEAEAEPVQETLVPNTEQQELASEDLVDENRIAKSEADEASPNQCDRIGEEELLKYLKAKEGVFSIYSERKNYTDWMLNQKAKWGDEQVRTHMRTLGRMRIAKMGGLRDNDLKESRYVFLSSTIFEWAVRTKSLPYQRKYNGEEVFFTSKLSKVIPCADNDGLFERHKDALAATFMGDFELVDY